MVNNKYLLLLLIFLLPHSMQARVVKNIVIHEVGTTGSNVTDKNEINACKKFIPNKKQIINYFSHAEESKEKSWLHEYYSSCVAYGNIEFKDGLSGKWLLLSSGVGYVTLPDGSSINFFYKNNNWEDPFACTYGLGDEPEC